jgi:hypothetical protein
MEAAAWSSGREVKGLRVWGVGGFENEIALHWVEGLEDAIDLEMVESTLEEVLELDEEGDVPGAASSVNALAAAETVATLAERPTRRLPEEVRQWCFDIPAIGLAEVQSKAVQAVGVVLQDSWIRRFFEERGEGDEWEAEVEDLRDRLRG